MLTPVFRATATSSAPIILFVGTDGALSAHGKTLDKASKGALNAAMHHASFTGKAGQSLTLITLAGIQHSHVIVVGVGDAKKLSTKDVEDAAGNAIGALYAAKVKTGEMIAELPAGAKLDSKDVAAHAAFGAQLKTYRFDKYRTKEKPEDKPQLKSISVVTAKVDAAKKAYAPLEALAESIAFTRNIVSEPANIIYPESLAAECKKLAKLGLKVEVLGEAEMKKLGMGSLLGVGQGSVRESQLVIMQWNGGKKSDKPVALVGKGVTFDTGGISIKPSNGMEEMKWDMAGSAAVIGTMRTLAARKAKVNVVGVVGLVENMPDGNAQRPGDVVTSMSGQTIEVLNTDAEGRLVLADALWYTKERFKPQAMIDLATLTGAIIVAIGSSRAGLYANKDKLAEQLHAAGEAVGERLWRMPLGDDYDKLINCDIADMQNISAGREAGSVTAAQFLQRFVGDTTWAHLDIAGTAWANKPSATIPKGATAFGVRLLNTWIQKHYE
ncbi:MAG: leucyl aminopeptidase [Alphaproteobacteria bacterium]|nr:leucyl aminopeptidase [Alphaproteobacteria bacterium]